MPASAGRLRFIGKPPRGILCMQHPCDCATGLALNTDSSMRISNSCLPSPDLQAAPSSKVQAKTVPAALSCKQTNKNKNKPRKTLRKLKCKDYMRFLCIIIFSLHAPSPVFLFVSEPSKEIEQQRMGLMLTGKHPENKATEISGYIRTLCAKITY